MRKMPRRRFAAQYKGKLFIYKEFRKAEKYQEILSKLERIMREFTKGEEKKLKEAMDNAEEIMVIDTYKKYLNNGKATQGRTFDRVIEILFES